MRNNAPLIDNGPSSSNSLTGLAYESSATITSYFRGATKGFWHAIKALYQIPFETDPLTISEREKRISPNTSVEKEHKRAFNAGICSGNLLGILTDFGQIAAYAQIATDLEHPEAIIPIAITNLISLKNRITRSRRELSSMFDDID